MKIYFTPGPSQLHHTYEEYLRRALKNHIGSISHRGERFQSVYAETERNIRELLEVPPHFRVLFLSSATDIWERIIQNMVENHSHHFVNGAFSQRFYQSGLDLGKKATQIEGDGIREFASLAVPETAELIAIAQNESAKGYAFRQENLRLLRENHPDKLIALDAVSATPVMPVPFEHIDTAYFSVQKCFGMPPGLAVWMISPKAIRKARELEQKGIPTGAYRSIRSLLKYADRHQTPETPNIIAIYILGKIAREMLSRGIKNIRNESVYKSAILYQTIENHPLLSPAVASKPNRSQTVIVVNAKKQEKMLEHFNKMGIILGRGYGKARDAQIRIANFPSHSKEMVEMLCDELEKIN